MNNIETSYIQGNGVIIGIAHTTRLGGVSKKPFDSFNLGLHVLDNKIDVEANRQLFAETLGLKPENMVYMNQVHGNEVCIVNQILTDVPTCDAMVTNTPNLALCVLTADCIPIVLIDNQNNAVAAIHAGWRGTVQRIVAKAFKKMQEKFGSKAEDILAFMGPGIQPCCYQVGDEVYQAVKQSVPDFGKVIQSTTTGFRLDLHTANRHILIDLGVLDQNIHQNKDCVCCKNQTYFSYRADNGQTGRMAMIVWIKGSVIGDKL